MWTYEQTTGKLTSADGSVLGKGYSGQPPYSNDPLAESMPSLGPIPKGKWQAVEMIPESSHGPYAIRLEPYPETETYGRSGFMMHGERISPPPGLASDGCIIQPHAIRELFWESDDHDIEVVQGEA